MMTRINPVTLKTRLQEVQGQPRTISHCASTDVCVAIGAEGREVTQVDGRREKGSRINVPEFRNWLKVTLDIKPPKGMIRTPNGDFMLQAEYKGKIYLKGLLLPSGGVSAKPYDYGYNFAEGHTTRDRVSLSSASQEAKYISAIWSSAIMGS
jgi:hypothetical protein